jgi:hypothetical protein
MSHINDLYAASLLVKRRHFLHCDSIIILVNPDYYRELVTEAESMKILRHDDHLARHPVRLFNGHQVVVDEHTPPEPGYRFAREITG